MNYQTKASRAASTIRRALATAFIASLLLFLPKLTHAEAAGDTQNDMQQARDIKLKRIANTWANLPMELQLKNGETKSGKFIIFEAGEFRVRTTEGLMGIPSGNVDSIILKRQAKDLLLAGLTAAGGAALLGGAVSLSATNAPSGNVAAAALVGGAIGFALGWKIFYQNVTIRIE